MKKICFITPYFGNCPRFFHIFLKSCEFNPSIDFIIYGDMKYSGNLPKNVRIIYSSLEDFNKMASKKLNCNLNIPSNYNFRSKSEKCIFKITDLRPALGLIFSELLKNYDFWGTCDFDAIYGDIRKFTNHLLDKYDLITAHESFIVAHFVLYSNINKVNKLFMDSKDWKKVFESNKRFSFNECNKEWIKFNSRKTRLINDTEIESFTYIVEKASREGRINALFKDLVYQVEGYTGKLRGDNWQLSYDRGKLYNEKGEEILYTHYMQIKNKIRLPKRISDKFIINSREIKNIRYSKIKNFFKNIFNNQS